MSEAKDRELVVQPEHEPETSLDAPGAFEARYARAIPPEKRGAAPGVLVDVARGQMDARLRGKLTLESVVPGSSLEVHVLGGNGAPRVRKSASAKGDGAILVTLSKADVAAIRAPAPRPDPVPPLVLRAAQLVTLGGATVPFGASRLHATPVRVARGGWVALGLDRVFGGPAPATTSVEWRGGAPLASLPWLSTRVGVDGRFDVQFPERGGDAWLWWLSGPLSAVGAVLDDLEPRAPRVVALALPPFSTTVPDAPPVPSPNATEVELAQNPQIYSEDAGAFCKPFSNPERVLGERSFHVILRAEQPAISSEGTIRTKDLAVLDFDPPPAALAREAGALAGDAAGVELESARVAERSTVLRHHTLPKAYLDLITRVDRGRTELDARHPVQWEGDITRYQAATVARGHILEYRVRWRANGYSLGTVAKTLTLAPRQVKRIQKIEWERAERTRREERTQLTDRVEDRVTRERTYEDEVRASLSEWARGESSSSQSAAAGGFGFAAAGFVIGGGGGGSHASSASSQEGGRRASATEEQRLRDEIRRYGDALRRFESVVVNEVTQEETVTGTTEVVRNPNYGHALTVIYHQILRHLRIETAFAAVRECLFVPFAMRPFTIDRAYRWRETLQRALRDRRHAPALTYLRDVLTGFVGSDVPAGRRSDQPIRHIFGSLFLTLGIERPKNAAEDKFDEMAWTAVRPFLGVPALAIYTRLAELKEARRDRVFQEEQAPRIAAGWVDTLQLSAGGTVLAADFTLASRYSFNGTVRVDFSIAAPPGGVTRETLASLTVKATRPLTPGSIANFTKLSFTYQTEMFQRSVAVGQGANDLVTVETGAVDPAGATIGAPPDTWERQNLRAQMTRAAQDLVQHLNEHLEHYHKAIWWHMDRDRLFMLVDGYNIPRTNGVSIASVVERDPIAIIGNALVFRVSAGSFLGLDDLITPEALHNYYAGQQMPRDPMHVSLPTDGLYAQVVMDECSALEEHHGNTDWVLAEADPALPDLAPELLQSRRAEPASATPTPLPQTIINLQNAPEAPAPSGLAGVLGAVTNANAFRDMAGLAGTQSNAAAALQTAASLATNFGNQAAALKLAELAAQAEATRTADQKVASVKSAKDKGLTSDTDAADHTNEILKQMYAPSTMPGLTPDQETLSEAFRSTMGQPGSTIEAQSPQGSLKLSLMPAALQGTPKGKKGAAAVAAAAYGEEELVPDIVYIVNDPSAGSDPFVSSAREFHTRWGLKLVDVLSLQDIVAHLAKTSTKVKARIRIVTHAWSDLGLPFFTGMDALEFTSQSRLEAFNKSDGAFLSIVQPPSPVLQQTVGNPGPPLWEYIATQLAGTPSATAFGLSTAAAPTGAVASFMVRRIERGAVPNSGFSATDATTLDDALIEMLRDIEADLAQAGRTTAEIATFGTEIDQAMNGLSPPASITVPPDRIVSLRAALTALRAGFRTKLSKVKKKLTGKWVDIRCCSIGQYPTFLEAVAAFFGVDATKRPGVTAPDLFMGFPGLATFSDQILRSANDLVTEIGNNPALIPQMDWWAIDLFPTPWAAVSTVQDKADLFYKECFAKDMILPVFNADYSAGAVESLVLYRPDTTKSMDRFLISFWGTDLNKKVASLRDDWNKRGTLPNVPALSHELTAGTAANPNWMYVQPDREFKAHIKTT